MQMNWFDHLDKMVDGMDLLRWTIEPLHGRLHHKLVYKGRRDMFPRDAFRLQVEVLGLELLTVQATRIESELIAECNLTG